MSFCLLTIHWFNPLMWLAYVLFCRDIEFACDEKVIRDIDRAKRAEYSQALVTCSVNRRRIIACPLAFGEISVKERVKSVMNYKKPAFRMIVIAMIACITLGGCFLTDPKTAGDAGDQEETDEKQIPADSDAASGEDEENEVTEDEVKENTDDSENAEESASSEEEESAEKQDSVKEKSAEEQETDEDPENTEDPVYRKFDYAEYEQLPDGTWQANGRIYQYRLEIRGRMHSAAYDSTYVYLSNIETITFDQAWKAAGYSSNMDDYFDEEDALLVESILWK